MIQSDIKYISEQKENFFSKLFNSRNTRLEALRQEEFKALDLHLLTNHDEYKTFAERSIHLLNSTNLKFKILDYCTPNKNFSTSEWTGEIDVNGHAYCNRITPILSFGERYKDFGKIDHFGKITINTYRLDPGLMKIITSFLVNIENGELHLLHTETTNSFTGSRDIETIASDPFAGNEALRKEYVENRKKLFHLISKHRVKV